MVQSDHIHILIGIFGVVAVIGAAWWMHIDLSEVIRLLKGAPKTLR